MTATERAKGREMRRVGLAGLVVAMGATGAWAGGLPTTDEVLQKVKAKWAEVKSFRMDEKMTLDFGRAEVGTTTTIHVVGQRGDKEDNGKCMAFMVAVSKKSGGKEETRETRIVNDGQYVWQEERRGDAGDIRVSKDVAREWIPFSLRWGAEFFEMITKNFDARVVGEESIDGKKMYVVQSNPRKTVKDKASITGITFWIGEDDWFIWRCVYRFNNGKGMAYTRKWEVTSVKLDQKIAPEDLEYTEPVGAEVADRTGKVEE